MASITSSPAAHAVNELNALKSNIVESVNAICAALQAEATVSATWQRGESFARFNADGKTLGEIKAYASGGYSCTARTAPKSEFGIFGCETRSTYLSSQVDAERWVERQVGELNPELVFARKDGAR